MDAKIVVVMRMYWQYSFYITVGTCHPQVAVKEDLSVLMLLKSEKQSSYNSWTLTGTYELFGKANYRNNFDLCL